MNVIKNYNTIKLFGLAALVLVLAIVSLFIGVKNISPLQVLNWNKQDIMLLTISRFPRTIALLITGVGMSICGLIMQQITQNKFVSPTTSGSLDAAKLGILTTLIVIPQEQALVKLIVSFLVTFSASLLFIKIINNLKHKSIVFVPIVGLLFGGIINSITSFFAYKFNIVQDVGATRDMSGSWLMGDFSGILQGNYEAVYLCLPAVVITYVYASKFTVIGMGKEVSLNLGLNYNSVLNIGLLCVSLTISAIVVTVGIIPFLGLVIPNIISHFKGDNLKATLPYTALFGAAFLLVCDIIGRLIIFPFEVPIGLMIGLVGGFSFLILLIKKQ
ncbi:ABC transporter permease [Seonamhaeicola sp. NFXS20]|uniref:ABC transporter permease n=1 Tax=Seonamhaeicola sp. NFXS20 TaxID=2816959 RepID=UPI003B9E1431